MSHDAKAHRFCHGHLPRFTGAVLHRNHWVVLRGAGHPPDAAKKPVPVKRRASVSLIRGATAHNSKPATVISVPCLQRRNLHSKGSAGAGAFPSRGSGQSAKCHDVETGAAEVSGMDKRLRDLRGALSVEFDFRRGWAARQPWASGAREGVRGRMTWGGAFMMPNPAAFVMRIYRDRAGEFCQGTLGGFTHWSRGAAWLIRSIDAARRGRWRGDE